MSGFFSDNQTKQKAFDRYYNAMAKSDFVQGKKVKALIQHESLDDASSDSLANLFQQVMAKNREYDYDQITRKLLKGPKGPPEIIKGEAHETSKATEEEPSITRQLFQDSDVNESSDDEEIKEEKRLRKLNPGIKKVDTDDINRYKSQFAANLYESIRHRIGEAVDQRKGKDYFEDNAPKAPRKHKMKRDAMNQYKAEMKAGSMESLFKNAIKLGFKLSYFFGLISDSNME
ncbi:unnamed protein product [Phytophthora lilii]|uniref:Unnamed protein product n=1 Tax=Phytophthora lilii TaxID=2077276 RepID=A0A9W7CGB8_9STRA|nr:unnamed protein product [Phytophthora lilii]